MAKCKSCGASIIWSKTVKGKAVPLDVEPTKRYVLCSDPFAAPGEESRVELRTCYRSHFVTCPHADKHRKGKKDG